MQKTNILFRLASVALICAIAPVSYAEQSGQTATGSSETVPDLQQEQAAREEFRSLDQGVQSLKEQVLNLNRDLFLLEEELLFPANSQVAFFVSVDVGEYFALDSVSLKIDGKEVANYLYTDREAKALLRGGVHRIHIGNLKAGEHELVAVFTGEGPHLRDYRRGASLNFDKGIGAQYIELRVSDRASAQQPEFVVQVWE